MSAAPALVALALAWALWGTWSAVAGRRSSLDRLAELVPDTGRWPRVRRRGADPLAWLGAAVIRATARVGRRPAPHRDPAAGVDRAAARRVGAAAVALALVPVSTAAAGLAVLAVAAPELARRRRRRGATDDGAAIDSLPDAVDLLAVVARAGLPALPAVAEVAERAPPPWGAAFGVVVARAGRGERFADVLDELPIRCGDAARPVRAVLRAATDDGADLAAGLERLAVDARDLRRRRAEEAARRIPVRLLLPLVACSLPAFALLSIVPILVGALRSLDL